MKVLVLEHPRIGSREHFNDIANTPLWSCLMGGYAASALRESGQDVVYCDAAGAGWNFERTRSFVLEQAPSLLSVNAVYFWEHTGRLFEFLEELRRDRFQGHINLFGFYPSLAAADIIRTGLVDSVAAGECETTLRELGEALSVGGDWRGIDGLATDSYAASRVHRKPEKNLDGFAFPERPPKIPEPACVLASRGCYNHCSFCLVPPFYNCGPLWRGRSPENVVAEIESLMRKGCRDFYFVDPNFIGPGASGRLRCLDLLERLRPLNIAFGMETRPNDLTETLLDELRRAGLKSLLLGIESGSARMLERIGKGAGQDAGERAIALCRSAGIEPEVGFIMFLADTSLVDIRESLDFLGRNRLLDRLDRTANLLGHRQIVLKGTSGYARLAAEGRLQPCGFMGFEGLVRHADRRVAWLADTASAACHWVLRQTGEPGSPVYWKNAAGLVHVRLNEALTNRFRDLLELAAGKEAPPDSKAATAETERLFGRIMEPTGNNMIREGGIE